MGLGSQDEKVKPKSSLTEKHKRLEKPQGSSSEMTLCAVNHAF